MMVTGFLANKPFQLAAALSYYTLLSLAPLLLLLTGLAGLIFGEAAAREHLLNCVGSMVGTQEADTVRALLTQAGSQHASMVSTVMLVIGATTVFAHLQTALNQIWPRQHFSRSGSSFWAYTSHTCATAPPAQPAR